MRGKLGVSTVTHKMKKTNRVACDCERCKYSNKKHGFLYCPYFDLISPNRSQCIRYWGVKPKKKRGKNK